jgi:hypothetical protein
MHEWGLDEYASIIDWLIDLDVRELTPFPLQSDSAMVRPLVWYITLPKARRSGRFRQTPQCLDSREHPDCGSENDECPIDGDSRPCLCASFQVKHCWVDEAEGDTVDQLRVTKPRRDSLPSESSDARDELV